MEQTVYIDLYFLINFGMDLLCLVLASRLLSYKLSLLRAVLAAALGGGYACIALLAGTSGVIGLLLDLACGAAIGIVALKRRGNIKQCIFLALVFAAASVLMGGFMTLLFSLFNKIGLDKILAGDGMGDSDGVSVWLFAVLALISGALSLLGGKLFKKKSARRECTVRLSIDGRSTAVRGLCDSGNLLCEPISGKPCIIVERKEVEKILSPELLALTDGRALPDVGGNVHSRLRIIPTQTVNGTGMLYALRLDAVRLEAGGSIWDVDAFVALGQIGNTAEGAMAIVPAQLMIGAP